jgi:hypothetical protein
MNVAFDPANLGEDLVGGGGPHEGLAVAQGESLAALWTMRIAR